MATAMEQQLQVQAISRNLMIGTWAITYLTADMPSPGRIPRDFLAVGGPTLVASPNSPWTNIRTGPIDRGWSTSRPGWVTGETIVSGAGGRYPRLPCGRMDALAERGRCKGWPVEGWT